MVTVDIPNRPFSSEIVTGLMLPDGIFESSIGKQRINAQFKNSGGASVNNINVYVESVSNPGIVITPATYSITAISGGAATTKTWDVDVSSAPPGQHYVSFIAEDATHARKRIIKKIFVTKVNFDAATSTFSATTPEGVISAKFKKLVVPANVNCCCKRHDLKETNSKEFIFRDLADLLQKLGKDFKFCPPGYLPLEIESSVVPTPNYPGQYGDLPFQDPWWKVLLCIIAVLLLIAAAINEAVNGDGEIVVSTGGGGENPSPAGDCCGVQAEGSSSNAVTAGLVAAAAAAATAAALSDVRDPFRRGQDNTNPGAGEITIRENLSASFNYIEPIVFGTPFSVGAKWEYTRVTVDASMNQKTYSHSVDEVNQNVHLLSKYVITAPDIVRVYRKEPFVVKGEFFDKNNEKIRGERLFVKCFLLGPSDRLVSFMMQDDGLYPDDKPNDGIYTGVHWFSRYDVGLWKIIVIAQDINNAQPDMKPEEAAQIIGGIVLTHQLSLTFQGGTCPFVPDGDVNVIV